MTKEETELIIKEQDKSTKEILKVIEKEKCELLGIIQGKDKAIKELEKKLEQTEKDLADYQFNYPSIKELSKENAELVKTAETFQTTAYKLSGQLAQAKELIKGLLDLPDLIEDRTIEHTELIGRAEQFLEEEI